MANYFIFKNVSLDKDSLYKRKLISLKNKSTFKQHTFPWLQYAITSLELYESFNYICQLTVTNTFFKKVNIYMKQDTVH